jgi:hypothetical protein
MDQRMHEWGGSILSTTLNGCYHITYSHATLHFLRLSFWERPRISMQLVATINSSLIGVINARGPKQVYVQTHTRFFSAAWTWSPDITARDLGQDTKGVILGFDCALMEMDPSIHASVSPLSVEATNANTDKAHCSALWSHDTCSFNQYPLCPNCRTLLLALS